MDANMTEQLKNPAPLLTEHMQAVKALSNFLGAFAHGKTCTIHGLTQEAIDQLPDYTRDNRGNRLIVGDLYVIVTCPSTYKYYINVTCDSVLTMAAEVLNFIQYK